MNVMPAKAGTHDTPVCSLHELAWMAAYAAMTGGALR